MQPAKIGIKWPDGPRQRGAIDAAAGVIFAIGDDPVKFGLVNNLARPGHNVTGINFFTNELVAKRFGLLRELIPGVARVAVLVNPSDAAAAETTRKEIEAAAGLIGLQIQFFDASTADEIDAAFVALAANKPDALFVAPGAFFNARRVQLATLAARYTLPASYSVRDYAGAGGLMSYGTDIGDAFYQVGRISGRVLRGENPSEMPVIQATKFEFVINRRTASALELTIPSTLLARADEVIE